MHTLHTHTHTDTRDHLPAPPNIQVLRMHGARLAAATCAHDVTRQKTRTPSLCSTSIAPVAGVNQSRRPWDATSSLTGWGVAGAVCIACCGEATLPCAVVVVVSVGFAGSSSAGQENDSKARATRPRASTKGGRSLLMVRDTLERLTGWSRVGMSGALLPEARLYADVCCNIGGILKSCYGED